MTRLIKKPIYVFLLLLPILIISCKPKKSLKDYEMAGGKDSLQMMAKGIFQALPVQADNPQNPITPEKVTLGKRLYFDAKLSMKGNNSCNSCHNLSTFGVDHQATSTGDDGLKGGRNSNTVLNVALDAFQFWDGRAKDVEEQAGMPILNPVEMHIPGKAFLEDRLKKDEQYPALFAAAFPNDKNPLKYENLQKAIGAFERTLLTPSRFDDYLNGKTDALTQEEKDGLSLFLKTGCNTCHMGVNIGGQMFQKFGVYGNYWEMTKSTKIDSGRISITKNASDLYVFKVPTLRNIAETYPYFHDGSISKLDDAVKIMAKLQLNKQLTDEETKSIVVFLKSLTGKLPDDVSKDPFKK